MNEKLKFYKGNESALPDIIPEPGSLYHCEDTGNTYLATENSGLEIYSTSFTFSDEEGDGGVNLINADTLNGEPGSNYVTKTHLNEIVDELEDSIAYVADLADNSDLILADAESLGGLPAENYATKQYVTETINNAQLSGGEGGLDIDLSIYATKDEVDSKISAINYPVKMVNGKTGNVVLNANDVKAVPLERLINNKPLNVNINLNAADVGAVPTNRTINSKPLNANIVLTANDVKAVPMERTINNKSLSSNISLSATDVKAVPTDRTINSKPLSSNISLTAADVGARSSSWVPSLLDLGITATASELNYVDGVTSSIQTQLNNKVPTSRTINNKSLTGNITLTAADVGARSSSWVPTLSNLGITATAAELNYVDGVTSSIQTQLNARYKHHGTINSSSADPDLNSYTGVGNYWVQCSGVANTPFGDNTSGKYGHLICSGNGVQQFVQYGSTGVVAVYLRDNVQTGWKDWRRSDFINRCQLLWTNASPGSSFTAQNISLAKNHTAFSHLMIVFRGSTTANDNYFDSTIIPSNAGGLLSGMASYVDFFRMTTPTGTATLNFGSGHVTTRDGEYASNDSYAIPYQVYGLALM